MKGNDKLIAQLNARLAEELTAINQYFVHAEMCDNWKYERLHEMIRKRAIVEMKHAEKLIERILFLEGQPIVSKLNTIAIGAEVPEMHRNDLGAEQAAVRGYNETIRLAAEVQDNGTREPSNRSSWTKRDTSTGSRPSSTRSSRWGCRTTWPSRYAEQTPSPGRRRRVVFPGGRKGACQGGGAPKERGPSKRPPVRLRNMRAF